MARLLLVSNRLPVTVRAERGEVSVTRSSGGLATGLRGPHEKSGGAWIGWPGDVSRLTQTQRANLDVQLADLRCVPVHLSPAEMNRYYDGFSNAVLWPLFHYLLDRIPRTGSDFDVYAKVNEKFAEMVAAHYQEGDIVWVHDYQLCLVPALLRQRLPTARIGYFLHIPFPASEVLRTLPWREQILEGLLGADLIGFHTFTYRSHFASAALRILGIGTSGDRIRHAGRSVRLGVYPMGIDTDAFTQLADSPEIIVQAEDIKKRAGPERIFLGVDRLDYTKGIPRRLLAFERLLEREPGLRGKVRMVQVAVPSRDKVESYQEFRKTVNELVGRINGAYGTVDWAPIHYMYRSLNEADLVALYRAADVMLVTPLRDGMNLVAKEFVTCRTDEDGVLVLSEFAGAAAEMGEAVQVNPYDVDALADTYAQVLQMPEDERRFRMRALRRRIVSRDVHSWAKTFIEDLERTATEPAELSTRSELDALTARLRGAGRLLLILDYDGTLVPFARAPELAAPDPGLRDLLASLAGRPNTRVVVLSGQRRESLERWLGHLPVALYAEHGYWARESGTWEAAFEADLSWKRDVRAVMDPYAQTVPGALIEEKTAAIAWHYRMAEPELGAARADELWRELEQLALPVRLLRGERVVEVIARDVSKRAVVERMMQHLEPGTTVFALSGEGNDDRFFEVLPEHALTARVGFQGAGAKYRLGRPKAARALLHSIL
jgi:trehalose 6-phosphate synthase/phosphatase